MSTHYHRLIEFFKELKRRKVLRVITVYAASAFVILELVDILAPSLGLPDWTLNLVLLLLCVGFVIAVIVSWIYDIHPEEGIVKTEPADKVEPENITKSSYGWKIASYISFVVIIGLIVVNILPRLIIYKKVLEKSIAVLPLEYLSEDPNKEYLANGVLDAITGHLSLLEGLRVMPRTSVEQYRNKTKSAQEIGEELDVSYLIEGSFLMVGDHVKLIIQLVNAREGDFIFFKEYDRNYNDILAVQSEVAQTIAKEIEVAITPDEKALIEKVPTRSLTAYDFYQRGKEEYNQFYWGEKRQKGVLEKAENLFYRALDYDSTFAMAYTGLAFVHLHKHYWETFLSEEFLDSALMFATTAQTFDNQLADAFLIKGIYYNNKGKHHQAIEEFNKAIRYNPNNWWAFSERAKLYDLNDDLAEAISDLHKAASLNHDSELPVLLRQLCSNYRRAGFFEKARGFNWQALQLDNDSSAYFGHLSRIEGSMSNFENAIEYAEKAGNLLWSGEYSLYLNRYEEALIHLKELSNRQIAAGDLVGIRGDVIGLAYWKNGFIEEAKYFFDKQISYHNRMIELDRESANMYWTYYYVAGVFAVKGETEKAMSNLNFFIRRPRMCISEVININNNPAFDNIRDEPDFQRIVRDIESKYHAEHERVRQWLEENDML